MMHPQRRSVRMSLGLLGCLLLAAASPETLAQTWSNTQTLSGSDGGEIKEPAICPAASGGFHAVYRVNAAVFRYRRYQAGSLSASRDAASGGTLFGGDICEAGNGDLHVVFEDWDNPLGVGWVKSADGGINWTALARITNYGDVGKIPVIAPYGSASSAEAVMSCGKPPGKELWYNRYNGTAWAGYGAAMGNYESEYELGAICRSLQDGSVYRSSDDPSNNLVYRRFNGSSWSGSTVVMGNGFYPRQSIAVNAAGQVMVAWDDTVSFYARVYTPGSGFGPATLVASNATHGMITAIPGSTDFYAVYCRNARVRGKRYFGMWPSDASEEIVSVNQPVYGDTLTTNAQVCAGPDGSLYACWEYWDNNTYFLPRAYYSVKQAGPPQPQGTLSGTVVDQYGVALSGAAITSSGAFATVSGAGGTYSMSMATGSYTVSANKDYYTGQSHTGVVINENQTTTRNFVLTGQAPAPLQILTITQGNTQNHLVWTNPASANLTGVMIRYSTTAAPTTPAEGTLLTDASASPGTAGSFVHTGLTNGSTVYYAGFAYFTGASRYYSTGLTQSGTPAVKPDFDRDGDVDQADFGHLQACFSGANQQQTDPACADAQLDIDDLDVDGDDFNILRNCLSGDGVLAASNCAN